MNKEIKIWADIKDQFNDGLILGNGASIAVHQGFSYKGLFSEAKKLNFLGQDAEQVFKHFDSEDFEAVLRHLWNSKMVFDALKLTGEPVNRVNAAYTAVRAALIRTVRATHVSYPDALPHLEHIHKFLRGFKTVLSLNYDLIVYWAGQYGNNTRQSNYHFKDCFDSTRRFPEDWVAKRQPYGGVSDPTLYFYPHGNLALVREPDYRERKVVVDQAGQLLETILGIWEDENSVPLFVCEGTSGRKKNAIDSSAYLGRIYREVIPSLGDSLVIYGWSLAEQEQHIIDQIVRHRPKRVAVSIRNQDKNLLLRAEHVFGAYQCEVIYFDSDSPGVWNHALV
jgi:hypothetical protein